MLIGQDFLKPAKAMGFNFFTGVPCSFLTPIINAVISEKSLDYVSASSEGEAVSIAAGAWIAGKKTVVMCQNSGLGNAVNPLSSLNYPFRIPTLFITTWRGQPKIKDEPQHILMGKITQSLLNNLLIPHQPFPKTRKMLEKILKTASIKMTKSSLPYALIMEKGIMQHEEIKQLPYKKNQKGKNLDFRDFKKRPARIEALESISFSVPKNTAIIASTGKCSRELFTIHDTEQNLYQVGSMGCASSMGLGISLNIQSPVLILDGDGAILMKMGTMATIGAHKPKNLIHVILDNETHDSTGGQKTVSPCTDFATIGKACGYKRSYACDNLVGLQKAISECLNPKLPSAKIGPFLIHMKIKPGSISPLGRPTIPPHEILKRFKNFLKKN